jgi:ATPase subunit of ABC transporter with duplicated ATPase domains
VNGCGKSTLMKIIVGDWNRRIPVLSRSRRIPAVGYLAQVQELTGEETIYGYPPRGEKASFPDGGKQLRRLELR